MVSRELDTEQNQVLQFFFFDRAKVVNAMNAEMIEQIQEALHEIKAWTL